jgi:hypothetical protein
MSLVRLILFTAIIVFSLDISAQINQQYKLKAAYIYNFTKYIDWKNPNDENTEFIIGILGDSEIYPYLTEISRNKKIKTKIVVIDRYVVDRFDAAKAINYCDILFVPVQYGKYITKLNSMVDNNTLLIGESTGFAAAGGAINFLIINNLLKFEINSKAILQRGFMINVELLKLAILIEDE